MLPPGVLHMSAVGCFGRFTFSHLAFHIPTLAGSCLCLFCVVVCLVALFLCFWFLFCKCLGIPNSPRSLDLDDRQGLIARSAMQQKKKAAFQAIEDSKALHARRWQTKEGTYRIKRRALPDVRDEPLQDENAAASCSDDRPRWRCWDGDYAMGVQHHT